MSASFARMATKSASIKAPSAVSGGKRAAVAAVVGTLACTPLDWLSAQAAARLGLSESLARLRETFIDNTTTLPRGATLVVDDVEYSVRANEPWDWPGGTQYTHLVLEMLEAGG